MHYRSHRLRKGRISFSHQAYLITTNTYQRRPLFTDLVSARTVIRSLKHADEHAWSNTFAFILMPDHLHWLLQLGEDKSLPNLVQAIKSFTAHALASRCTGNVWQDGYHDHAVRDYEDLGRVARYVVANPLRARLVDTIGDYPWWDATWLVG